MERTIQSVINQHYDKFEHIVIDGKSTDKSIKILKNYEKHLVYWKSESDKGQSDGIRKGFKFAKGNYLCWLNADDIFFPSAFSTVASVIKKFPEIDIITGNVVYIDENDRIIRCIRVPKQNWSFYSHGVGYFTAPAIFFRKALYEKVGGIDIHLHYSMDLDLWHKFREENAKIYHINEYIGAFRIHSESKTGPRMLGNRRHFEHPETRLVRERYIPHVSKKAVLFGRILFKFWQLLNFNYLRSYFDFIKLKNKTWKSAFGQR